MQTRTLTKFSFKNGTRKSVKSVVNRFFRLHWGIWIRTIAGRHKKLWKKSNRRKIKLQQHVFCNRHNSKMLDIMVTKFWRKPKYYIDDPYSFYHTRNEYSLTRRKPWRPENCDYE
ncbi:mitochondrial 50S ribosomal protein L35 [Pediculus humanus corporis]|uniref:Large ribosomal subunit protein bL35m n=1 Tax=Pediculus humanus subsp. corporis TaxID=121224 RepID=E0VIK0_PEDHC|nr:mitochondrial 50S ribosomal protein L35 [Pediculus humanus corporis]EEB13206.1 mitochondrial 50S ribosomal protein L35 [Pediculus humanus corporis]